MKKPAKIEETNANIALVKQSDEAKALAFHEQGLKDCADGMYAFGLHLYAIRSKELWKAAGLKSFKEYCDTKIPDLLPQFANISTSQVYRLADWAEVSEDVKSESDSPIGESEPAVTESQARELAKAPKAKRAKILKAVADKGGPTAKKIKEAVQAEESPKDADFEELDKVGVAIPKALSEEWSRATELGKDYMNKVSTIRKALKEDDPIFAEAKGSADVADVLFGAVKQIIPYAVCPVCKGKKCKTCSKRGFVSQTFYKQSLPDEAKEAKAPKKAKE